MPTVDERARSMLETACNDYDLEIDDLRRFVREAAALAALTAAINQLDEARALLREAGYALDPYANAAELGQWGDTPDSHYLVEGGPDITLGDLRRAATIRVKITAALGNLTATSEGEG